MGFYLTFPEKMKHKGYQFLSVLFAFAWLCLCVKLVMARHTGHRHIQEEGCLRCPPGYGVIHRCSRDYETVCSPCKPGHYYSSHHSARKPCYPCSRCGFGLYVAHACTPTKDTVCDSCHTFKGPHNQDFHERCVQPIISTGTNSSVSSSRHTEDVEQVINARLKSVQSPKGFPPLVAVAAAVVTGAMVVIVVVTLCVSNSRRHSKMVDCKYQAVATQEAIML